jgi:hypothetical protein
LQHSHGGHTFYFWYMEGCGPVEIAFATSVSLAVAAAIAFVSRRVLPALVVAVSLVGVVAVVSAAKQQVREIILHAYDVVAVLKSGLGLHETWHDYRDTLLGGPLRSLPPGHVWVAARIDKVPVLRRWPACCFALLVCLAWAADSARGAAPHGILFRGAYVLGFYSHGRNGARPAGAAPDRSGSTRTRGVADLSPCRRPHPAPSRRTSSYLQMAVQPSFPSLDYAAASTLLPSDGRFNKLRVDVRRYVLAHRFRSRPASLTSRSRV